MCMWPWVRSSTSKEENTFILLWVCLLVTWITGLWCILVFIHIVCSFFSNEHFSHQWNNWNKCNSSFHLLLIVFLFLTWIFVARRVTVYTLLHPKFLPNAENHSFIFRDHDWSTILIGKNEGTSYIFIYNPSPWPLEKLSHGQTKMPPPVRPSHIFVWG